MRLTGWGARERGVLDVEEGHLDRRRAASTEFLGPVDPDPPVGGQPGLPATTPLELLVERREHRRRLDGGRQPGAQFVAEAGRLLGQREIHGHTVVVHSGTACRHAGRRAILAAGNLRSGVRRDRGGTRLTMATPVPTGESRLLIDGKLVDAAEGGRFDNVDPANEQVLGQTADATAVDMDRAIAGARAAFDTTTWSTDRSFRQRCLRQLHEAIVGEQEQLRAELVAEVGCPVMTTYLAQLDAPLAEGLLWPAGYIDAFEWERDSPRQRELRRAQLAAGGQGAGRSGGRHHPVELPVRDHDRQARAGTRHRQHHDRQAGPRHPVERHPDRAAHRRADRHPCRGGQRGGLVRSSGRRADGDRPPGRPHLVHRIDHHGPTDHGRRCTHPQAPLPRARRQVGRHHPGRR